MVFQVMLVALNVKIAVAPGVRDVLAYPLEAGASGVNIQFPYCVFARSASSMVPVIANAAELPCWRLPRASWERTSGSLPRLHQTAILGTILEGYSRGQG